MFNDHKVFALFYCAVQKKSRISLDVFYRLPIAAIPRFRDQVVVVTGAPGGIGRALCLALADEKARLVPAAWNEASCC